VQKVPVRFYRSGSGDEPGRDWLKSLSKAGKKILGEDIATVQYGWPVGMPLVRKMEPNLWAPQPASRWHRPYVFHDARQRNGSAARLREKVSEDAGR